MNRQVLDVIYEGIKWIGKNIIKLISILFAISIISFVLMAYSPLDPLTQYLGGESAVVSNEQADKIAQDWGFDKSYPERYVEWMGNMLRGDLGKSSTYNQPVISIIKEKASASLLLMSISWVITGLVGFGLGVLAAMKEGTLIDKAIKVYALTMASAPAFWVGLVLIIIFSIKLGWFPVALSTSISIESTKASFKDILAHLVLPAMTLSLSGIASVTLHTRQKLLEIFDTDYILFAKARGESKWMMFKNHGFRNVLLPAITIQFASLGEIFGGSALAEKVFSYPGLGNAVVTAGIKGDIPLLLGISLFSAVFIFAGNLIADMSYHLIDPRIREGYKING